MESKPEGFVTMELQVDDARMVSVKWTVPDNPNGNMFFDVFFEGPFYKDIGNVFVEKSFRFKMLYVFYVTVDTYHVNFI